eukprot:m.48978 g.48978  ORF g.48978 m.48978 type:complete len:220 (-) comp10594_c0_seq1:47-706(-)
MNADGAVEHTYSLIVEKENLKECSLALLHTVIFHRATSDRLRPKDVECSIDCTYVMCDVIPKFDSIVGVLYSELSAPASHRQSSSSVRNKGAIRLDFYRKHSGGLFGGVSKRVWETWRFEFELRNSTFGEEHRESQANIAESLRKLIMEVMSDILKKTSHVPGKSGGGGLEGDLIDDSLSSRPYLFDVNVERPKAGGNSGFTELLKSAVRSISTVSSVN